MRNLQIRKGNKINVPNLELAELGYSIDTKELHIGNGDGTYATFIDDAQLGAKINAACSVLEPKKAVLQRELSNKVKLDNIPIDLNFKTQDNVIYKAQIAKSKGDQQDYEFATRAEHVVMNNGLNYEKVYTGLLKNSAKTFTSTGEPIIINNAIPKQKILGLKINGPASQVVIVNNNERYSFYKSLSDQASGKILALGASDSLEVLSDGTGILTQGAVVTNIPKVVIPVIQTYKVNRISLDSVSVPAMLQVTLPVNKIEENQARINALKGQVAALATLLTS